MILKVAFKNEDSIKGLTVADIITKALGLEVEEELVGSFLPKEKTTEDGK